ncbi:MFS transporter [Pseudomonas aeruginosa]|uniref:Major Facilitator Superfamily protein n=1 Tax=Pseudomonas paraeruginosa TaxID=2994495 RepID=A0A2R3J1F6_9PSED|nr:MULTISPECIES: MFS transporter [Pseudomonas]VTS61840.1 major facilitator superfamily protein [Streptococcus dysgalactiae subsp. equisimilis]AVK08010.1 major Facilitator Superfamily protein [Pseudomonas paraeruginosa]AWE94164.1 major Facilitator Superfamily protein [Pseudomonas paraeruginosa]ELL4387740.1 MFS transporter [Pseudomonas aeruginosa]KAA5670800.1 MFS transporter [Pseudomonas aeruginosa]
MRHFDNREFKRGWHVLVLAIVGVATSSSSLLLYSFSSMVIPLEQAMGWARSDLQAAITALSLGTIVAAQLAGWLNLRYGLRAVTLVSLVVLSLSLFMLARIGGSIWMLYLGFFLVPLAGVGTLQITWSHLVNLWFEENRGFALAIILSGSGLAAIMLPLITSWAIGRWNWQAGFIALGLLPVLLALPLALRWLVPVVAVGDARAQAPMAEAVRRPGILLRDALGSWRFWICNLSMTLVVACVVGMVTNIVPLLQDRGLSASQASQVFSSFGISLILGRLVVGYLIDRLWAPGVAALALLLPAFACLIFAYTEANLLLFILATLLVGIGAGAEFDIAAFLIARYFGMRDYGRLFGVHLGLITAGAAASPLLFGALLRDTGSYTAMLGFCFACFVVGPLLLLTLGGYPVFKREALPAQ